MATVIDYTHMGKAEARIYLPPMISRRDVNSENPPFFEMETPRLKMTPGTAEISPRL